MTPPSTFQIAPVTQLVAGESRKVMVLARSRAVPTRPSGWKPSKLCSVSSSLSLGTKRPYSGGGAPAGGGRGARASGGGQLDGQVGGQRVQPGLGHRVRGGGGGGDGLVGPHAADVDDGPAAA